MRLRPLGQKTDLLRLPKPLAGAGALGLKKSVNEMRSDLDLRPCNLIDASSNRFVVQLLVAAVVCVDLVFDMSKRCNRKYKLSSDSVY